MRTRLRAVGVAVMLVAIAFLSSGCLFNLFQTARTVGAGNVALTIGTGLMDLFSLTEEPNLVLTPQARLAIGLSDQVDLGIQSGALISLQGGEPGWMGAVADLKFAIVNDPESFGLALGFGGGYSAEYLGWGLLGEVFFDSNIRVLPIFIAYQAGFPLVGGEFTVLHHIAGGLKLRLSETARLLLEVDFRNPGLLSYGLALEITF